ncbi:receptor-like cytosolic serine/threonine-protein kinase RBK1 isoform X1 [Corylus avellana]|uniref:receptor-like cytosolic serine/threonine-protein kinase RBK1 isoform X1 n=2 Tax=Corylus avellana TaxID=13451 RepID=UPI00286D4C19|nr:receptor-like cytosolic serine/threonine-protein kinase RBK1 isoform X1 [Corylus avellana]
MKVVWVLTRLGVKSFGKSEKIQDALTMSVEEINRGETEENPEIETEQEPEPEPEPEQEPNVAIKKLELSDDDDTSPRGVLEIPVLGTPDSDHSGSSSFSSSCVSPPQKPTVTPQLRESHSGSHWKSVIEALKKKSRRRFSTIPSLGSSYDVSKKNLKWKLARIRCAEEGIDYEGVSMPKPSWRNFDYAELSAATDNFSPENLIGKGGHAEVYKGCLSDGQVVAVKRITKKEKKDEDRISDFLSELGIIAHINHPNAARLLGFGIDGGLHLVLQFSPHGSLSSLLFGSSECLEWKIRFKVAAGVAEGLQYLHHKCHRRIIHRDIKASNILLTQDYDAQISDFGLAKWLPEKWAHHVVFPIEGTFGYLAPEYFMHGIVDEKTDVFAFGVLLLELITGRRAVDSSRQSLVIWAKPLLDTSSVKELADPRLEHAYDPGEMRRAMYTASVCIHHLPGMRPQMNRVVQLLKAEGGPLEQNQKSLSTASRSLLFNACDLEDYTCSNYLNDLNRHRQLVME